MECTTLRVVAILNVGFVEQKLSQTAALRNNYVKEEVSDSEFGQTLLVCLSLA